MINLLNNELIKLLSGKKLYAFLMLIITVQLVPVFITLVTKIKAFDGQTHPLSMLGILVSWLLPIFLIVIIAEIITDEYQIGMLSLTLIHPVSRFKLLASKALFLLLLITCILFFSMVTAYIIGTIFFGWGGEFLIRGIIYTSTEGFVITLGSYLISAIPLLAFGMFIMFLALLFNSSALVVGISAGILFTFTIAGQVVNELQPYLITTYFSYFSYIYFFLNEQSAFLLAIKIISLFGLIPYVISNIVLYKRDLTY